MATDHPLFIHRYLDRSVVGRDSPRFRVRVKTLFEHAVINLGFSDRIDSMLRMHAGIEVDRNHNDGTPMWDWFFDRTPIANVLTALTLTHRYIARVRADEVQSFVAFVRKVLSDENLGYRMDDDGSFRFSVDEDFAAQRTATLKGLGHEELASAREHYEAAFAAMNEPMDPRAAIREVFEAVEVVARVIAPNYKNLNGAMIRSDLLAAAQATMPGDATQRDEAWPRVFRSFAEWVDAIHFYRHGQPAGRNPTEDFAVFILSTGGGYLRLLCQIHSLRVLA
ncbi:hypothetical protein [Rhizobacter fulvus]